MNTHDIDLPPLPEMEVLGHDSWQKPIYGYSIYTMRHLLRREIEADRKRISSALEARFIDADSRSDLTKADYAYYAGAADAYDIAEQIVKGERDE